MTVEEQNEEYGDEYLSRSERYAKKLKKKNERVIREFLGGGQHHTNVVIFPHYYYGLLAWALQRHIERAGWQAIRKLGYRAREPVFVDVQTDREHTENLLRNGQILIEKGRTHLIVTADIGPIESNSVSVEGLTRNKKLIDNFVKAVEKIGHEENIYRGQKIEAGNHLKFLDVQPKLWDSIILSDQAKGDIRKNTVEFLQQAKLWNELGVPTKRGIILAGEPGTGKTIACRAVMSEAEGITCLSTSAYQMASDEYISDVYAIAQDLSPCLVFVEDLELVGQDRVEFGMSRGPALLSLLAEMDGVESRKEVVTVATTNCLGMLDKAISQRPSRFDLIIQFQCPNLEERRSLIRKLCEKIKVDETPREYIARKTEGCTPAQIQEIIFGLAIEYGKNLPSTELCKEDMDRLLSRMKGRRDQHMGFIALQERQSELMLCTNKNKGE